MTIRNWPTHEQPREKLLHRGAAALSDAELLAIFMRTGVHGKSAVDLSREMLADMGGLRRTLEASQVTFCSKPGCGSVKYVQLQAALELGRRYLGETISHGHALADPQATYRYLAAHLRHERQEVFACLFLDNQHRVLCYEELARGTLCEAMVYPREVVKRALHHNAAAIILSHNHPSGIAQPSTADKSLTEKVKKALALIDTRVIDHIIIGEGETFSFAEWGMI